MGELEEETVNATHRENLRYLNVLEDFIEMLVHTHKVSEAFTEEALHSVQEELTALDIAQDNGRVKEDLRGMLRTRASTESPNQKAREFLKQSISLKGGYGTDTRWILDNSLFIEQLRRGAEE